MTSIITKVLSIKLILALNSSLFTPSSIIAQGYTNRAETHDSLYQIQLRYDMMGGILGLSCKDQDPEFLTVGFSDLNTKSTITPDTPFRIASISKLITALGVLKLIESNGLDLDTPINHYLDFTIENPNYPDIPITTRHLLSHQSSLRDGTAYDKFLSLSYSSEVTPALYELLQSTGEYYSEELFGEQAPGNWFQYSNLGFGILGTLIEQVSREAFDVYIKREIFDPIGLKAGFSSYTRSYEVFPATLYRKTDNQWRAQADWRSSQKEQQDDPRYPQNRGDVLIGINAIPYGPQGGLRISARDLMTLLGYMQNALIHQNTPKGWLKAETIAQMTEVQWHTNAQLGDTYGGLFRAWGLGIHILTGEPALDVMLEKSPAMFGHSGLAYGLVSSAYFDPERGVRLSFITNGIGMTFSVDERSAFYSVEKDMFELAEDILKKIGC